MRPKRIFCLVFALMLLFSCLTPVHAFLDTQDSGARDAIDRWSGYGVLLGYNGYFRPDDSITRGEMAAIIDRVAAYRTVGENHFTDLGEDWYTEPILKVSALGIMVGYDGYVRPFDTITRAEAVIMLARAFSIPEDAAGIRYFDDAGRIPDWAAGYVGAMAIAGYLPFTGSFRYDKAITRSEVVQIFDLLLRAVYDESGSYADQVAGSVLISASDVDLTGSVITGSVYIAGDAANTALTGAAVSGDVCYLAGAQDTPAAAAPTIGEDEAEDPLPTQLTAAAEPLFPEEEPQAYTDFANWSEEDLSYTGTELVSVTVFGGRSLSQTLSILEERGVCDAAAVYALLKRTDLSLRYPILSDAYRAECIFPIEGYIVPGVYSFHKGSSPALVVKTFLDAAAAEYSDYALRASELGYSLHELLTIASIIEKEVGNTTEPDRATVASVIYNRLSDKMRLQMNVTQYYLSKFIPEELAIDIEAWKPYYDTYVCPGLPAGPICSPRRECIEAALNPSSTKYLFFRSDSYGNIYYAVTYDQHLENGKLVDTATSYLGYLGDTQPGLGYEDPIEFSSASSVLQPGAGDVLIEAPDLLLGGGDYSAFTVMIDPGHGGSDVGAVVGDVYEKNTNLAVAFLVRDLLASKGVQVVMTRTDDTYSSPKERAELANLVRPDVYLSIHCNTVENKPEINGIETFYYPEDEESRVFANYVQSSILAASGAENRNVKQGKLIVLHFTEMPAVLVELGFMTNAVEGSLLLTQSYREKLAAGLANGVLSYLDAEQR